MKYASVIAIDPGASGAAVLRSLLGPIYSVLKFEGRQTMLDVAALAGERHGQVAVVIERVWASPVMGISASFAFGENYGGWVMAMKVAGFDVFCVTPQVWQKVSAPGVWGQGGLRKAALKELANVRFDRLTAAPLLPQGVKVTLKNCDALLLSDYALTTLNSGKLPGEQL